MNRTRKLVTGVWGVVLAVLAVALALVACSPAPAALCLVLAGVAGWVVSFCLVVWCWARMDRRALNRAGLMGGVKVSVPREAALRRASCEWLFRVLSEGGGLVPAADRLPERPNAPHSGTNSTR